MHAIRLAVLGALAACAAWGQGSIRYQTSQRPETGAVARSAQDKLNDTVYAADFGAVADGATDESSRLQAAITAAAGKVLRLAYGASGRYVVGATLTIPSNTTMECDQGVTLKLKDATSQPILQNLNQATGNSGIHIRGCTLDGNKTNQTVPNYSPLLLTKVSDSTVESVTADGNLDNTDTHGVMQCTQCTRVQFLHCSATHGQNEGLELTGGSNNSVVGGTYSNNGASGVAGNTDEYLLVSGVTACDNSGSNISVAGKHMRIVGNYACRSLTYNGFSVGDDAAPVDHPEWDVSGTVVVGNTSLDNAQSGIGVFNTHSKDVVVSGNFASGNGTSGNGAGIVFYNVAGGGAISGNVLVSNVIGLRLYKAHGSAVNGNRISRSGYYGIAITDTSDEVITGNSIFDNCQTGPCVAIYLEKYEADTVRNLVANNKLYDDQSTPTQSNLVAQGTGAGPNYIYDNPTNDPSNVVRGPGAGEAPGAINQIHLGWRACANDTSTGNVCIGAGAGQSNTDGAGNVFQGQNAGGANIHGNDNTDLGYSSCANATGNRQTCVGKGAGFHVVGGDDDVFIGPMTDIPPDHDHISRVVAIGSGVTVTTNDEIMIGNCSSQACIHIYPSTPGGSCLRGSLGLNSNASGAADVIYGCGGDSAWHAASYALPDVGTPGTYTKVTTDAQGRVTEGAQATAADVGATALAATVSLTDQWTGIMPTNLRPGGVVLPAGFYRISAYAMVTNTSPSGLFSLNITWNDGVQPRSLGALVSFNATTYEYRNNRLEFYTSGTTDVQWSTTFTGLSGSPRYSLRLALERLN